MFRATSGKPSKRSYLLGLIRGGQRVGFISDSDFYAWDAAIELRNCIVHNNAIASRTQSIEIIPNLTLEFREGRDIEAQPHQIASIVLWAVRAYARWSCGFLAARRRNSSNSNGSVDEP